MYNDDSLSAIAQEQYTQKMLHSLVSVYRKDK